MKNQLLVVEKDRFFLNDARRYCVTGIIPESCSLSASIGGRELPSRMKPVEARSAMERFRDSEMQGGVRVELRIELPEPLPERGLLKITARDEESKRSRAWYEVKLSLLKERQGKPQYFIEEERIDREKHMLRLRGWAAAQSHVSLSLLDEAGKEIDCRIQRLTRVDVTELFSECPVEKDSGFYIEWDSPSGRTCTLAMTDEAGERSLYRVGVGALQVLGAKTGKYARKAGNYLRAHGMKALAVKTARKIAEKSQGPVDYGKWLPKHLPGPAELARQRKHAFPFEPLISIVVPLYRTEPAFLEQLVSSVQAQTYEKWQLCLSDGSGAPSPLTPLLERLAGEDDRIRFVQSDVPLKIAPNTNAAISLAEGDYIAFADHDDALTPDALYRMAEKISEGGAEVLYSDEDKMTLDGKKFFEPAMKPDFNQDLLCTVNYICHLTLIKRSLLEETGLLDEAYDGAQDYDLILRATEKARGIAHVPRILYHWRSHENSTSENPESKLYAFEAGARAIEAHYRRTGVPAKVRNGEYLGLYRTTFLWKQQPLVTIMIPNKDHVKDLERCLDSILTRSSYKNYEILLIENNSCEAETFACYERLKERIQNLRVVTYEGPFNFSAINNFGERFARGDYVLLLNNDTEVINGDWLEELLGYGMRPDVGAVGARLYYDDNTIQHAGVVLGFGGIAGHCFVQQPRENSGYCHRIISAQNYSAVTAACMLVRRSVYEETGGMSEDLAVAFNDIDFCLKIIDRGYRIVYNPYCELYHYESRSRGLEDTPEKKSRFGQEIATLEAHWPDIFSKPDPYYNPNLTLKSQDFSLKRL